MSDHHYQIRPAAPADIPRIVELENIMRRPALTLADFEQQESSRPADHAYVRFVAERDGQVIGVAGGGNNRWLKPENMWCMIAIDPAHRGQGIGRALYEALQPFYREHGPTEIRTTIIDDHHTTLAWAERLGFITHNHSIHSELDLTQFDSAAYADLMQRFAGEGVRFVSFDTIYTEENVRRLFELFEEVGRDVPFSEERSGPTFEGFVKRFIEDPTAWLEATVIAIDQDDRWLGFTNIFRSNTSQTQVQLGVTGVRREFRGRQLALAIKVAGLEAIKPYGLQTIVTVNHSINQPILTVNRKMGYVKKEGLLQLSKKFV